MSIFGMILIVLGILAVAFLLYVMILAVKALQTYIDKNRN